MNKLIVFGAIFVGIGLSMFLIGLTKEKKPIEIEDVIVKPLENPDGYLIFEEDPNYRSPICGQDEDINECIKRMDTKLHINGSVVK